MEVHHHGFQQSQFDGSLLHIVPLRINNNGIENTLLLLNNYHRNKITC